MASVFIGIGSNLGDRKKNLESAVEKIKEIRGVSLLKVSSLYETEPVEAPGPDYLNGVIKIKTKLQPEKLLAALQKIEDKMGRKRLFKNSPRKIDLDILLYGKKEIKTQKLKVPHPEIKKRFFVKKPLLEIEPELKGFFYDYCKKR